MKRKKMVVLLIVLLSAGLLSGAALFFNGGGGMTVSPGSTGGVVQAPSTAEAREGSLTVSLDTVALAEAFNSRTFRTSSGGTITWIAGEGDEVKEGDLLLSFDTANLDKALALAEIAYREADLNLKKSEAALEKAEKLLSDRQTLHNSGAVSREQVETARDGLETALHNLRSAELSLEKSLINLNTAQREQKEGRVFAPFDGTVLKTFFSEGDWAGQNSALLLFGDLSSLRFRGEIDEYDIARIEKGMAVSIVADSRPDRAVPAEVERVSPQAEVVSNIAVFTVTAVAPNPGRMMKPGMSADMTIQLASDSGIIVPSRAVSTVRSRSYVDLQRDETVETVRVTVGASDGINTVILEGVDAGDLVLLPAQAGILPGLSPTAPAAPAENSILPMPVPGSSGGSGGPGGGSGGGR